MEEAGREAEKVMQPNFGLYISDRLAKMLKGFINFSGESILNRPTFQIAV